MSQGCHTVYVEAWNNMGVPSGVQSYGPVCYDTVAPTIAASFSGTRSGSIYVSPVHVTLSATDGGSGVQSIDYQLDGGGVVAYASPLTISAQGSHTITYYSVDVAGNRSNVGSASFSIESPTTTKLAASTTSTIYGDKVTLTATVGDTFGSAPTGTVQFKHGSTVVGSAALSGGKATLVIATLPVGSDSLTASYAGSAGDKASSSSAVVVTIKQAKTETVLASSKDPQTYDEAVTFTATVKPSTSGMPTGKVTFKNGSSTLATVNLSGGKASYTTSALTVGSHAITADYSGSAEYATSASSTLTETVKQAKTSTTLESSKIPSTKGQKVTFTAVVKASSGKATGTVSFMDGSKKIGTETLSSGKATFTTGSLATGTHSIKAIYGGATDYAESTSAALSQKVNP